MSLSHQARSPGERDPRGWDRLLKQLAAQPADEPPEADDELVAPTYRRRVLARLRPELRARAARAGLSIDAYAERAESILRNLLADAVLVRRVWPHTLEALLRVGRMFPSNQIYEHAEAVGLALKPPTPRELIRFERELACFGRHPIYASLAAPGVLIGDPTLDIYGSVAVTLHAEVLERTAFAMVSVFEGEAFTRLPCRTTAPSVFVYPLQSPSEGPLRRRWLAGAPTPRFVRSWQRGYCERPEGRHNADRRRPFGRVTDECYMSALVLGQVAVSEVQSVVLPEPDDRLGSLLDEHEIPWSVCPLEWLPSPMSVAMGGRPRSPCREQIEAFAAACIEPPPRLEDAAESTTTPPRQ